MADGHVSHVHLGVLFRQRSLSLTSCRLAFECELLRSNVLPDGYFFYYLKLNTYLYAWKRVHV